tara:strand:+ start:27 stop:656 length:630 start_codon:yes stop_codon:yes gene_type:complete
MKLPKIIHQIWIGPDEMPEKCKEASAKMKAMHHGWEYKLWDNEAVFEGQFKDDPYLKSWKNKISSEYLLQPAFIADRVRLLILKAMGGIYVDIDALPIRPFDDILPALGDKHNFFGGLRQHDDYSNMIDVTVLGAEPNARVINTILEENDFPMSGLHISWALFKNLDADMCIFGEDYFYTEGEPNEKTIILHEDNRMVTWTNKRPEWML